MADCIDKIGHARVISTVGLQQMIDFDSLWPIGSPFGAGWVHYKVHYTVSPIPPKAIKLKPGDVL